MTEESFQLARKVMQQANHIRGLITTSEGEVSKWTRIEAVHRENGKETAADGAKKMIQRALKKLDERKQKFADMKFPEDNMKPIGKPGTKEYWLNRIKEEQKNYPSLRGRDLNEQYLDALYKDGFSPIDALNALLTQV